MTQQSTKELRNKGMAYTHHNNAMTSALYGQEIVAI